MDTIAPNDIPGRGNLGLTGKWALVGNSSAMVVIAVAMLLTMGAAWSMHQSGMESMREMNERAYEIGNRQMESLQRVIERNTTALDRLTNEFHLMRGAKE